MEQGSLFEDIPELRFCQDIFIKSKCIAKKRLPYPISGETKEEYQIDFRDEIRLEFCAQLRNLADKIEKNTLARQNKAIDCLYKGVFLSINEDNNVITKA